MCVPPCQTCIEETFYSCSSCIDPYQTLTGSLCIKPPEFYFQLACIVCLFFYILPPLLRKRSLTAIKILDYIQIIAYFKLIKGYSNFRYIWLFLGMRSWGEWSEGWIIISGDQAPPIWTNEEGTINKAIRIGSTWVLFYIMGLILGAIKVLMSDREISYFKYLEKNIGNIGSFAFYFTLQDIGFAIAVPFLNPNFSTIMGIISFVIAVVMAVLTVAVMVWMFYRINYEDDEKYYNHRYIFLLSADYDLFPVFEPLDKPKPKQIKKYSNIRIIDMVKKISFSFLIVDYLSNTIYTTNSFYDELHKILGFLIFFEIVWLIILPYNITKEYIQFSIGILAFGITIFLLFAPWSFAIELLHIVMVFILIGLGILSIMIEYCFDIYRLLPIDLYETETHIHIKDNRLLNEIAERKKEQEEMGKKIVEIESQNEKLKLESEESSIHANENDSSEISLPEREKTDGDSYKEIDLEKASMNSEEIAELYKVDELKRRTVYQWNKQIPFVYSNKIE